MFKETPTYQLLHSSSINDKNAVQAKHIRKAGIPVSNMGAGAGPAYKSGGRSFDCLKVLFGKEIKKNLGRLCQ